MAMPDLAAIAARLFAHTPATVFSILGLLLLAGALALAWRALRLGAGSVTIGTIVDYREKRSEGETRYVPVFRYKADDGSDHEVQSSTIFEAAPGTKGEPVQVRYDPARPRRAELEGRSHPWRPAIALLVLAAGTLTVAWQAGAQAETDGDPDGLIALP